VKKIVVIGSGFAGMSAASFMAKAGWDVTVLEKHDMPGGRARRLCADGFVFDMGPSWYWMPGVFERYFNCFGTTVAAQYALQRLDPSYRVYWPGSAMDIPAGYEQLKSLFEQTEKGAGEKLDKFLAEAAYKYDVGINRLVHQPGHSLAEFLDAGLVKGVLKLDVFTSMKKHIRRYFSHPSLVQLLEFPVLFLGALPQHIPALYSLMNYADIKLGTWYPQGGMYEVVNAMHRLAEGLGVRFLFGHDVKQIKTAGKKVTAVVAERTTASGSSTEIFEADVVIGGADYHFIEQELLAENNRTYSKEYWDKRVMAPSCLLYYVGINKKLRDVLHHSLFFDVDFDRHGKEIYDAPQWPQDPLFYVSVTSVTDPTTAPEGCENLFFLIPVATGLTGDTEALREKYFDRILARFEARTGQEIRNHIVYKRSYAVSDFSADYNAYKGNAYGLANTLMQTAVLKPSLKSKKLDNLYFTGQLTVPGPGVPPSLISGEVVAKEIIKAFSK
jgi:phytoene desaturase